MKIKIEMGDEKELKNVKYKDKKKVEINNRIIKIMKNK
jgi:hypothetical protein